MTKIDEEITLFSIVEKYRSDQDKSNTEINEELKNIIYKMKKSKGKRWIGTLNKIEEFNKKVSNRIKSSMNNPLIALITSILLVIVLGLFTPSVIMGLFINEGEKVQYVWIIAIICAFVALLTKNYIFARLGNIAFSISTAIFTVSLIKKESIENRCIFEEVPFSIDLIDFIALSLAISAILIVIFDVLLTPLVKRNDVL